MYEPVIIETKLKKIFENVGIYISMQNLDDNLNLDSMQIVIILSEIEKAFEIDVFEIVEEFELPNTFNDYISFVIKHAVSQGSQLSINRL